MDLRMHHLLRRLAAGAITLAAIPGITALATPSASAATTLNRVGVYTGAGPTGQSAFEKWTGGSVPYTLEYTAAANQGWTGMDNPSWVYKWGQTNYQLVLSLQMMPKTVTASIGSAAGLAQCAAGNYNTHWHALATNLVKYNLANTIIRPGWEMNGNWFDWQAGGHEASYIGCFRQIVTTMRAVTGQHMEFNWNPASGQTSSLADNEYPGDAYVDQVGMDMYDWIWKKGLYDTKASQTPAQRLAAQQATWQIKLNGDHGLQYWANFAKAHGKPMTLPEWGLSNRVADNNGGGDDPYFIQQVFNFVSIPSNNVLFANYFNFKSPDGEHRLFGSTAFPQSAALFQKLVQAESATPAPVVTTPAPVITTPAPVVTTPAPVVTTPAPVVTTPAPVVTTPAPVVTTPAPAGSASPVQVMVATAGSRANATPFVGGNVGSSLYLWATVTGKASKVEFRIDDPSAAKAALHSESDAPFDLAGTSGSSAKPFSTAGIAAGAHTLSVKAYFTNGTTSTVSVGFTK
jgi:hypothetical protein